MPEIGSNPLLIPVEEVARLLSINRATVWSMHSSGRLGPLPVRLGRRTLWGFDELKAWTAAGCPAREKWLELKEAI